MRVIAGIYGGRKLKSPPNTRTRPTSDRLRESLFNIISPVISNKTRFLDLCAGTGAVGIEALSRGGGFVTFVDLARKNCALIEENLDLLEVPEDQTGVECVDAEKFLKQAGDASWDLIYYDPPYQDDYSNVLKLFSEPDSTLLAKTGSLIVEHHFKNTLIDELGKLRRWRILKQGETALSFFEAV